VLLFHLEVVVDGLAVRLEVDPSEGCGSGVEHGSGSGAAALSPAVPGPGGCKRARRAAATWWRAMLACATMG